MHCVDNGNRIDNAQSTLVRPSWKFKIHLREIHFCKKYGAHFVPPFCGQSTMNAYMTDNNAKRGLNQFWEFLTVIPCALKDFKR